MRREWSQHIGLLFTDGEKTAYVSLGALAEGVHRLAGREQKLREGVHDLMIKLGKMNLPGLAEQARALLKEN